MERVVFGCLERSGVNELIEDLCNTEVSQARPRVRFWQPFMEKYRFESICEIGVRDGLNFKQLIKHSPKLAVAVDCWIDDGFIGRNDLCYTQEVLDKQYETFKAEMADKPFVKIHRGYSFDVVKGFPDEFFDFIYIDADHTYEGVKCDLNDWYPKTKTGGVFCGHDYTNKTHGSIRGPFKFGVARAVDEFVKERGITTFFTAPNLVWGVLK